jgi:hypothetical protein
MLCLSHDDPCFHHHQVYHFLPCPRPLLLSSLPVSFLPPYSSSSTPSSPTPDSAVSTDIEHVAVRAGAPIKEGRSADRVVALEGYLRPSILRYLSFQVMIACYCCMFHHNVMSHYITLHCIAPCHVIVFISFYLYPRYNAPHHTTLSASLSLHGVFASRAPVLNLPLSITLHISLMLIRYSPLLLLTPTHFVPVAPPSHSFSLLLPPSPSPIFIRLSSDSILLHISDLFKTRNASIWNREDAHMWARKAAKKLLLLYDADPDLLHRVRQLSLLCCCLLCSAVFSLSLNP